MPKGIYFCPSCAENYKNLLDSTVRLVISVFCAAVEQYCLVNSPHPACDWTVIEQQYTDKLIPLLTLPLLPVYSMVSNPLIMIYSSTVGR